MKFTKQLATVAAIATMLVANLAGAQNLESVQQAGDWVVFVDPGNAKHCYIATEPKESKAMRDGNPVEVTRGAIRLFMGIKNGATEPSFLSGYPLRAEKEVQVTVGNKIFNFFTQPNASTEQAWPAANNDVNVVAAMKSGSEAVVTAVSQRGTTTVDRFSLSGFTAAFDAAVEKCK